MVELILLFTLLLVSLIRSKTTKKCTHCGHKMKDYNTFYWCEECGTVEWKDTDHD